MLRWTTLLLISLSAAACATTKPPEKPAPEPQRIVLASAVREPVAETRGHCVDRTPRTKIAAQIIEQGAALVFTTSEDVTSLRRRAAELDVPPPSHSVGPRLDNVPHGIRLVFDVKPSGDVDAVRSELVAQARSMAKRCGLVWAGRSDLTSPPAPSATPAPRRDHVPASSNKKTTSAARPKPAERSALPRTTTNKKDQRKPARSTTQPSAPKPPAKPADKPNPAKPPPLPRLPGFHPDPIAPD